MKGKALISEVLLHYIWRFRLFNSLNLKTTTGESIYIENVGSLNSNAGPDFEYARMHIGDTFWSGHVEVHVHEGDWVIHNHHCDKAYDTVILHVVWESTTQNIYRSDGTVMPTLVLSSFVDNSLLGRYELLLNHLGWIPCESQLPTVKSIIVQNLLSRLAVERLEKKTDFILSMAKEHVYDWEKVFLILLGRAFGMKVNAEPFGELCSRIDLQWLHKNRTDSHKVESMLFGLAGFLDHSYDSYSENLLHEYNYLQGIHHWQVMEVTQWRFLRMRPFNFPPYRIGQLAGLLTRKSYWFAYLLECDDLSVIFKEIDMSQINKYWTRHFRLGQETSDHATGFSLSFKVHLAINCFIPLLFAYSEYMKLEATKDKALNWLNLLSPEKNKITNSFRRYGINCLTASDSQALLHLKSQYCDLKRCLNCSLGLSILKS